MIIRFAIEMIGKPKEKLIDAFNFLIKKLENYGKILKKDIAEPEEINEGFFSSFVELEMELDIKKLFDLILDYTPSYIEILEPDNIKISSKDLEDLLNEIVRKLHDMDNAIKLLTAGIKKMSKNSNNIKK